MTRITRLYLIAFLFVITNGLAKNASYTNHSEATSIYNEIQRVRIYFTTPNGFTRYLLLAFTPDNAATDGFDYGYDGRNLDIFPDDLNWMIEDGRFLIQGVGAFDITKKYPLGLFLKNSGEISINFEELENFDTPIDIFVFDALLEKYTRINDSNYTTSMASGEYTDRFFIAFKDENASSSAAKTANLDLEEYNLPDTKVSYLSNTKELYINTNDVAIIKNINIYNILGQNIMSLNQVNSKVIKIRMDRIKTSYGIVSIETDKGILSKKLFFN